MRRVDAAVHRLKASESARRALFLVARTNSARWLPRALGRGVRGGGGRRDPETTTRGALKGKSKIPVSKRDKTGITSIYFSANRQINGDREIVNSCKEWPQIPNAHFKFRRADPKTCPAEF
eukprot:scaffold92819_cov34-Phaeocystis_antarctica.AAC.1